MAELRRSFRPEFLNRLDETILFRPLTKDNLTGIIDIMVEGLRQRLADRSLKLRNTPEAKELIIDRGYDMSGDISNRRFAIWGSGLEIFKKNVLFGTTFSGFLPYAKENLPDTYIVNNDYLDMETLDNDFMNLLVSDGALGFICFAVFVVWVLAYIFRYSLRDKTDGQTIAVLFAVCATAAAASMFSSGVLFMQCEYSILFWAALGLLVCFGEQQKKEGAHG